MTDNNKKETSTSPISFRDVVKASTSLQQGGGSKTSEEYLKGYDEWEKAQKEDAAAKQAMAEAQATITQGSTSMGKVFGALQGEVDKDAYDHDTKWRQNWQDRAGKSMANATGYTAEDYETSKFVEWKKQRAQEHYAQRLQDLDMALGRNPEALNNAEMTGLANGHMLLSYPVDMVDEAVKNSNASHPFAKALKEANKSRNYDNIYESVGDIVDDAVSHYMGDAKAIVVDGQEFTRDEMRGYIFNQVAEATHDSLLAHDGEYGKYLFEKNTGKRYEDYLRDRVEDIKAELKGLRDAAGKASYWQTKSKVLKAEKANGVPEFIAELDARPAGLIAETAAGKPFDDLLEQIESWESNDFGSSFAEGFDWSSALTFGIMDAVGSDAINNALDAYYKGQTLTPEQERLVRLQQLSQELSSYRDEIYAPQNRWSKIGGFVGATANMLPEFGVAMIATGGIGAFASLGGKAAFSAAKAAGAKGLAKYGATTLGKLGYNAGLATARGFVAAPFMPNTYNEYFKTLNSGYHFDESGGIHYDGDSKGQAYFGALAGSASELTSEYFGIGINKVVGFGARSLGRATGLNKVFRKVRKYIPVADEVKAGLQKLGWSGDFVSETLSEASGDLMNNIMLDIAEMEHDYSQLGSFDYWLTLMGTTAIAGAGMGSIGAVATVKKVHDAKKHLRDIVFVDGNLHDAVLSISTNDNMVMAASALAALPWDSMDAGDKAKVVDYIMTDLSVKVMQGQVEEGSRMESFLQSVSNLSGIQFKGANSPLNGNIVLGSVGDTSVFILDDTQAKETGQVVVHDAATNKTYGVDASKVTTNAILTPADYVEMSYKEQFDIEEVKARVADIVDKAKQMDNPTKADVQRVASTLSIKLPKVGKKTILANGAEVVVSEKLSATEYGVKDANGNTYKVHFTDIASSEELTAKAQMALGGVQVGTTTTVAPSATTETAAPQATSSVATSIDDVAVGSVVMVDGKEGHVVEITPEGNYNVVVSEAGQSAEDMEVRTYTREQMSAMLAPSAPMPAPTSTPSTTTESSVAPVATTEDGSVDLEQMSPKDAASALVERTGSIDAAIEGVESLIQEREAELAKVSKKERKSLNTIGKKSAEVTALEQQIAFYTEVLNELNAMREAAIKAEEVKAKAEADAAAKAEEARKEAERKAEEARLAAERRASIKEGLIENEYSDAMSAPFKGVIDAIAKMLGVTVEFVEQVTTAGGAKANGKIEGNHVYLTAPKGGRDLHKGLSFLFGHEVTHRMKAQSLVAFNNFKAAVKEFLGEEKWNKMVAQQQRAVDYANASAMRQAINAKNEAQLRELAKALGVNAEGISVEDLVEAVVKASLEQDTSAIAALPKKIELSLEDLEEEVVADFAGALADQVSVFARFLNDAKRYSGVMGFIRKGLHAFYDIITRFGRTSKDKQLDNLIKRYHTLLKEASKAETTGKFSKEDEELIGKATNADDLYSLPIEDMDALYMEAAEEAKGEGGKTKHSLKAQPSLVGVHNISLDKLRKVIKMGGLANPSVAVIDVDKQTHDDYGDYTLVLPKNMVDARKGKNAGTWAGDAWTPTYPQIVKRMNDDKAISRFYKDIDALPDAMRNRVRLDFDSFMEGRSANALAYWYLFEKGGAPELVYVPSRYSDDITNAIEEATNGSFSMYRLTPEERAKCLDAYIAVKFNGDRSAFEEEMQARINRLTEAIETKKSDRVKKWAQETIDSIKEYGFDYDDVAKFIRDVGYDVREKGKVNVDATITAAREQIETNNLNSDYDAWRDNLDERYGIGEYIFDGYTNSGNRRYLPHTVENASKWMKKQGRQGAVATFPSFGVFIANAIPRMTTLESIRKRKGLLGKSQEEYDAFREKWSEAYHELAKKLQPDAKAFDDYGYWRLIEAVGQNNPKAFIKKEYGIDLTEEDMAKFNEIVDAIRTDYPARYFETKFERPLQLGDFVAAVVPNDMPNDVYGRLKDANVEIFEYNKDEEGSRRDAMQKASALENVRFSLSAAPTFYSNAEYAVQNIKQEKATPEQWLKMIEKAGGIKAGEDKWLGLSDWLKASDKKTLTKDEVLQYIAENDIQIEEVSYGEPEYISENEIYESDVFSNLVASLTDYDEDDNPHINQEQYTELQNADPDFLDGFSLDYWGEGLDIDDKMAAARYLGLLGVDNEINNTRLQYTTQGLTKKKEIALVVPTIEPYKQSDEIHFGDAGEGRAVAWVRFGDAEAQRSEEVVRRVDEFETPYKDVNGHEIYRPKDRLYAKDFISYGKLKSGEYAYVVYVNNKQIPVAHKSLEDARNALNEYYKANPEKRTRWDKVLVIDEIQSKRHQDGREKGYSNRSVSQQELYEAQEAAFSNVIDYESALADKYGEDEWATLATTEEMAEYERLRALDEAATNAYENYDKGVPSAPFEKNWAELAFKRMLRYAAENGYDYVAWTTGDQQADRYDIGSVVKDIVTYDTKDADGNPIKKMKFRMNNMGTYNIATNMEGVIVKGDGEMKEGMRLSDITGKPLAEKIMSGEGEDAMVFENGKDIEAKSLEGEELHVGNEGMKAFYDQMLPSFVKKYTKKWGAEVGEVTMPDLGENNTMHAVNVTDSMRESVMQGQPKFSLAALEEDLQNENISIDNKAILDAYGLLSLTMSKRGNYVTLSKIVVDDRGKGNGTRFMNDLVRLADDNGWILVLTPDTSFGATSVKRLKGFYKRFGFNENKGRNTDFSTRERMVRKPQSEAKFSLATDVASILEEYDTEGVKYGSILDVADGIEAVIAESTEDTTELENILNDFRAAQDDARRWGNRMDSGGEEEFEEALRAYASQGQSKFSLPTDLLTDFAEEFNSLQEKYESLDPSTIDYKHPFRVRKREVVQKYADHVADVLGLPTVAFAIDLDDDAQIRDAYYRYMRSHKEWAAQHNEAPNYISLNDFTKVLRVRRPYAIYAPKTTFVVLSISETDGEDVSLEWLSSILHENTHKIIEDLGISDFEKEVVYKEAQVNNPKAIAKIDEGYHDRSLAERGEEVIAYAIEGRLKQGDVLLKCIEGKKDIKDVLDTYKNSVPLRKQVVRKILNALKDGYERKQNATDAKTGETQNVGFGGDATGQTGNSGSLRGRRVGEKVNYSLSTPEEFFDGMPWFDELSAEEVARLNAGDSVAVMDERVRTMLEDERDIRISAIRKQAREDRKATKLYYAEERRKRLKDNASRTRSAKIEAMLGDTPFETLPLEAQALILIAEGNVKIRWNDEGTSKGLGSELGLLHHAEEKKDYRQIWGSATMSFDAFVHQWWQSINGYERGIDVQDMRNALIDALLSCPKAKIAMAEVEYRYDTLAEQKRAALEEIDRRESADITNAKNDYLARLTDFNNAKDRPSYYTELGAERADALDSIIDELENSLQRAQRKLENEKLRNNDMFNIVANNLAEVKKAILSAMERLRLIYGIDQVDHADIVKIIDLVNNTRSKRQMDNVVARVQSLIERIQLSKARENMSRLLDMKLSNPAVVQRMFANVPDDVMSKEQKEKVMKSLWKASRTGWKATKAISGDVKAIFAELNKLIGRYRKELKDKEDKSAYLASRIQEVDAELHPENYSEDKENISAPIDFDANNKRRALYFFSTYLDLMQKANAYAEAGRKAREIKVTTEKERREKQDAYAELAAQRQEYIKAISEFNKSLEELIVEGKDEVHDFQAKKDKHATEIRSLGIKAIGGSPARKTPAKPTGVEKAAAATRGVDAAYWTFETVLRAIDHNAPNGKGAFYKHFMGMWLDANDKLIGIHAEHMQRVANKMRECFPEMVKRRSPYELYAAIMRKADSTALGSITYSKEPIEDGESTAMETTTLTISNAMYIIAMWRQERYRRGMERHGIKQEQIDQIAQLISAKHQGYLDFMNWVNDELLPDTRMEYDVVYRKLFGKSMDKEENYFPAVVEHHKEVTIDEQTGRGELPSNPSATKERTSAAAWIDMRMNYFKVLESHLQDMDQWACFAELTEDLNILLSSDEFRKRLNEYMPGMNADRTGFGSLYEYLFNTAKIATNVYKTDKMRMIGMLQKGWAKSNISYRLFTAIKQLSSVPIFVAYSNDPRALGYFAKHFSTMLTGVPFRRAMEISPSFRYRWQSRTMGMDALAAEGKRDKGLAVKRGLGRKSWDGARDFIKWFSDFGMTPNAAVDALACSVGICMIYDYEIRKVTKGEREATDEEKREAVRKAEIAFNTTQQSSENAYLSAWQLNAGSNLLSTYMNASYALHRKREAGIKELWKLLPTNKKYRNTLREGYGDDAVKKATKEAISELLQGLIGDVGFALLNGGAMMTVLAFIFAGDNDDDEAIAWEDAWKDIAFSLMNGIPAGNLIASGLQGFEPALVPAYDEFVRGIKMVVDGEGATLEEIAQILSKYGVGVDYKTLYNIAAGVENMLKEERDEYAGAWLKVVNAPEKYIKAFVGDRRAGETLEEYQTRILRLHTLFEDVRYSEYYDDEGKYIGDGNPSPVFSAKKAKELRREYEAALVKNVVVRRGGWDEYNAVMSVEEAYAEVCKTLGWSANAKPNNKLKNEHNLPSDISVKEFNAMRKKAEKADKRNDKRTKWVGDDDTYYSLLQDEIKVKQEIIDKYNEYIK